MQTFPSVFVEKLLDFLAEKIDNSPHLEFYLHWCTQLLMQHGVRLKARATPLMASIKYLQKSITQKQLDLGRMCVKLFVSECRITVLAARAQVHLKHERMHSIISVLIL